MRCTVIIPMHLIMEIDGVAKRAYQIQWTQMMSLSIVQFVFCILVVGQIITVSSIYSTNRYNSNPSVTSDYDGARVARSLG